MNDNMLEKKSVYQYVKDSISYLENENLELLGMAKRFEADRNKWIEDYMSLKESSQKKSLILEEAIKLIKQACNCQLFSQSSCDYCTFTNNLEDAVFYE